MKYRRIHRYLAGVPMVVAAVTVTLLAGGLPAQAAQLPLESEQAAFLGSVLPINFSAAPPGANVRCTPSAAHPDPVVLSEGTFSSMYNSFGAISTCWSAWRRRTRAPRSTGLPRW